MPPEFWLDEAERLYEVLVGVVSKIVKSAVTAALDQLLGTIAGIGVPEIDYDLINEAAELYARQYTFELVSGLTETNQSLLQDSIADWITSGRPLPELISDLEPWFGPVRADLIATTEVTNIYAESNVQAWASTGVVDGQRWQTAYDDIVCPTCEPLHGKVFELGDPDGTPAKHPRCRCWIQPYVVVPGVN